MAQPPYLLFDAARDGRLDDVGRYVEQDAGVVHAVDNDGWTPLMYAAFVGRSNVVRYLLDHGAEVDHRDRHGNTALGLACAYMDLGHDEGQVAVVELLLQRGAHDTPMDDGKTALKQAAADGRPDIVGLLLAHGGSDVDAMDFQGTALLYACAEGRVDIVVQLLEAGADPALQRTGANDQSPYEAAVENEHENVTSILQEWDRAHTLTRARRVHDDVQTVVAAGAGGPSHAAPAYLRERATIMGSSGDAVELPQVEVRADHGVHEEREGESVAEVRWSDTEREDQKELERSGELVARHVLQELSGELFVEFMGMCELLTNQASADAEDEVEEGSDDDSDADDADDYEYEYESPSGDNDDS